MSNIIHITDEDFQEKVINSDLPVLIDFWAEWCNPCKAIAPILDELSEEFVGKVNIVKLNIDKNQQTPIEYGIRSIPTLLLFKNGQVEATHVGSVAKNQLVEFINSNI